ncbi:MAG: beta-glucosidase [Gaiellaceae bacterium]|nr:beta-glucosidase [Gaiellaceae bacterium]
MPNDLDTFFPAEFVWGAATASYQIEGAANEDGRGESIWDRFSATPGKVRTGDTGLVACDFYHRYRDDVALIRDHGLDAFRFSIAWPRILPEGRGRVNQAGLDFYDRVLDELLANGIEPFVTLYHWDLPQVLEDRGGWASRETVDAFTEYVQIVVERLGDRVGRWITHNEPQVASWAGYGSGSHAPGRRSKSDATAAAHHLLLSHGRAVELIRATAPNATVGITLNLYSVQSEGDDESAADVARRIDGGDNRWFLDPIFRGEYPADVLELLGDAAPPVEDGDLAVMSTPLDFLGVNNYSRLVIGEGGKPLRNSASVYTDMDWEVYPDGLYEVLMRLHDEYAVPAIYITENGAAFGDIRGHDGEVRDPERQDYLEGYIRAVGRAVQAGVPVSGYFVWSFLDNFEWAHGYSKRFGIVYIDYPTLERVPKGSFHWYRDLIRQHRAAASPAAQTG